MPGATTKLSVGFTANNASYLRGVRAMQKSNTRLTRNTRKMGQQFQRTSGVAKKFAGVLLAAVGINAIRNVIQLGDELAKVADRANVSVGTLQALQHTANSLDIPIKRLNKSLTVFDTRIARLKLDTSEFRTELEALNPVLLKQVQTLATNEERLQLYLEAIANASSRTEALALSQTAFGQGVGTALLQIVQQGSLEQQRRQFDELVGGALNKYQTARIEEVAQSFTDLGAAIQTRLLAAIADIAPAITGVVHTIRRGILAVSAFISKVADTIRKLFMFVITTAQVAVEAINEFFRRSEIRLREWGGRLGDSVEAILEYVRTAVLLVLNKLADPFGNANLAAGFADAAEQLAAALTAAASQPGEEFVNSIMAHAREQIMALRTGVETDLLPRLREPLIPVVADPTPVEIEPYVLEKLTFDDVFDTPQFRLRRARIGAQQPLVDRRNEQRRQLDDSLAGAAAATIQSDAPARAAQNAQYAAQQLLSTWQRIGVSVRDTAQTIGGDITNALTGAVRWSEALANIGQRIVAGLVEELIVRRLIAAISGAITGAFGIPGGGAEFAGSGAAAFPTRATGGRVRGGTPYLVGESRPEIFIPDSAGYINPNIGGLQNMGGGAPALTINVDGVQDPTIVRNEILRVAPQLERGFKAGLLRDKGRPGSIRSRL